MRPAPDSQDKFERLKALLREMFQLDRGDLDFGLYRIMNMKAREIAAFLDDDLLPQVKTTLAGISDGERAALKRDLEEARAAARTLGVDPDTTPRVIDLNRQLAEARADAEAETDVYNHLANFFARYYNEGDFMSLRRYSGNGGSAYLIPYDGEEVTLHWANADQYYVKTTENYTSYAFAVGEGRRVCFEIAAADNEKDGVKEALGRQRRFVLAVGGEAVASDGVALAIRFEHRPLTDGEKKAYPGNGGSQQKRINEAAAERILKTLEPDWRTPLAAPAPTEADPERTLLAKHIERYTAKNSFDYFIHKDLGGFLRRELDFYLKNEVLNLDDLALGDAARLRRALARMRAMRQVADKIIAFLAQLEEFQKRLWLKKKFVLETHWCVTLDRVPRTLYPEIAANEAQRREWVALLAIGEIAGDLADGGAGYGEPLGVNFLENNPFMVLDTRHFDADFADRLLAALSDAGPLDERMDGLLIHGENFQALNLLQARYREQVRCVYIDPPYNTASSAIIYKNDYKDSSWLSMMENRLILSRHCLMSDGVICVAIDDEEVSLLRLVLENLFERELGTVSVRSNPAGRKSRGQLSPSHEYALFFGKVDAVPGSLDKTENELARYPLVDEKGRYAWNNLIRHGSGDRRQDRPTMYYPIYVGESDTLRVPSMEWDTGKEEYDVREEPRRGETAVWPIMMEDGGVIEKRWHRGPYRVTTNPSDYRIRRYPEAGNESEKIKIDFKIRLDTDSMPKSWWDDKKYASANLGAKLMKDFFGRKDFDFVKALALTEDCLRASRSEPRSTVLDFFAGSGTTGHAVIDLNRKDGGRRRYILVEVGDHFDTVLLPRMKKVVHSPDWKDGKPVSRDGGTQLFKYIRLESYEDTLDGLVLKPPAAGLLAEDPTLAEDYRLRYALGAETAGSASLLGEHFADPFAYTLSVVRDGARRDAPVDLPETFNYLIGLRVDTRRRIDGVLAITGTDAEGRGCLILWRTLENTDNEALEGWFADNREQLPDALALVYVNGDHTLNAVRRPGETWTAETIEPLFRKLMLDEPRDER